MATISVEVPDKLEREMNSLTNVDWPSFLKKAIELKAFELELERTKKLKLLLLKSITSKSRLSKEEADKFSLELDAKLKEERLEDLKEKGLI